MCSMTLFLLLAAKFLVDARALYLTICPFLVLWAYFSNDNHSVSFVIPPLST